MRIQWTIDSEEPLDPVDPLGSLTFEDELGHSFSAVSIYLDDWFDALLNGIEQIECGKIDVQVSLLTEPDVIQFSEHQAICSISYKGKVVSVGNIVDFKNELRSQIRSVMAVFQRDSNLSDYANWLNAVNFLKSGAT